MSVRKIGYLSLTNNLIDDIDKTKQCKLSLNNISTGTTRTVNLPNADTTLIGTTTTDTLTNKTIGGSTNTVDANNLKTTGTAVNVSAAAPPITGQVLTATSATAANWQTPSPFNIYLNNLGTVTNPSISTQKQWFGHATTSTGTVVFDVTTTGANGTAIFTSLANAYILTSCKKNTTSNTAIPFSSIQTTSADNKTVTVNVQTGASGAILVGGNYNGMTANSTLCDVYLYIIGV